ncbi:MAG: threonylcarbamoyl-AMP synthase [Bacteroidales bacterium]|nr:threonylcarbamoyl-AMP synthase [Bacteroidales bacterium]
MKETIIEAAKVLKAGGVILYPTDTVWGLGCDASESEAIKRIFAIKKRLADKSLVLLAADLDMVARYVREIPEMAVQLIEVNDAPMTIIYPESMYIAPEAVASDGSVGIRIPLNDDCVDLCRKVGRPIVSTSANFSGEPAPKKFADIPDEIKAAVDYIVDPELEKNSTGKASQVIKVGLDGRIQIIRA